MPYHPEGLTGTTSTGDVLRVREVWADNLADEIAVIRCGCVQYGTYSMLLLLLSML